MKISKLLLLCAVFGAVQVLNGGECSQIGAVKYKQNGRSHEFEIIDQWHEGKKLQKIDCKYEGIPPFGECLPMSHADNITRINNLKAYMKAKHPNADEWYATNRADGYNNQCEYRPKKD